MSDELIHFLRAQLDIRERLAKALQANRPGPWTVDYDYAGQPEGGTAVLDANGELVFVARGGVPADFAVDGDPLQVLADIDAKRRVIDDIAQYADPNDPQHEGAETDGLAWRTLINLTLPYTGQEEFREEWKL